MDAADSLDAEIAAWALASGLFAPGDGVLVAASGGADSAALASILAGCAGHGLPLRLTVGHVDHGWRGAEEAARDLAVVETLAARLQLPLASAGPPNEVRKTEDAARRFRYASLAAMARAHGCSKVATGHHLRDQAETFLLRLLRGSGPAGLAGIPVRRPLDDGTLEVVRPLLRVHPERLAAYVSGRDLPFRDDPTNAVLTRDRVRIRARLVSLGTRESAMTRDLARTAERLRARLERRITAISNALFPSLLAHPEAAAVEVGSSALAGLQPSDFGDALQQLGRLIGADRDGPWLTRRHVELARALLDPSASGLSLDLPHGLRLTRLGERILFARSEAPAVSEAVLEQGEGSARAGQFTVSRAEVPASEFSLAAHIVRLGATERSPRFSAALDADALANRLVFRAAKPADRFVPFGRDRKTGVLDFLSKQGVPGMIRRGVRVLETDGRIAWVLGHRIDARFAVTPSTSKISILEADVLGL